MRRIALVLATGLLAVPGASTARAGAPCDGGLAGGPPSVVPDVVGNHLDAALREIRSTGLRVSIARFAPFIGVDPEQGFNRLENYRIVREQPRAGRSLQPGGVVHLTLDRPRFVGPRGSLAVAPHRGDAAVPDLVGLTYPGAIAAGASQTTGIYVRVGSTGALTAAASRCGLAGFVVASQSPAPGTRVPWQGFAGRSVRPPLSTVTISLVARARP